MRAKGHCCRIFTPAQPVYPAASLRDFLSGAYTVERGHLCVEDGIGAGQRSCKLTMMVR
jgi:hypothetical protein